MGVEAMAENNMLMVNIAGTDKPGILAAFTKILSDHRVEIIDMQQASQQNGFALHLLLKPSGSVESRDSVLKDLLFEANKLDLKFKFQPVDSKKVQEMSSRRLLVITHFGNTRFMAEISRILAEENATVETISSQTHHGARSFEMTVNTIQSKKVNRLKNRLLAKSRDLGADLAVQDIVTYRKNKRMVCFDMDSTLVDMEGIDEIARKAGVEREVSMITEKAMRGDIDFEESLRQRVSMLKGLSLDEVMEIKDRIILSDGVDRLLTTLKWLGFKLGIVSGGFDIYADYLGDKYGLDFTYANRLEVENGVLTGNVEGDIVDDFQKARIVNQTACDMGIPMDQVVAIGDGANDALMLSQVGLGIAYNAKPALDRIANAALSKDHFNHVFHLLGITEEDIEEAISCKTILTS